ncbi:hypothetical protein Q31b_43220 [Novipirellula aureliae]|uniref:Autotransporter domain-containing protein n=1 Tax=Novipirellula aureliae TaxID=2527966 RepID=A0A5C6DN00_9BACT|nr:hypothetical protein [Novipirellula aureliae]TWU37534.1 hypothetical protein Q31b_43220 [Novipirellula aureliae]
MASKLNRFLVVAALLSVTSPLAAENYSGNRSCDALACDAYNTDDCADYSCDEAPFVFGRLFASEAGECWNDSDSAFRTPAMIGDFFSGSTVGFRANAVVDRLMVLSDDLDVPGVLPPVGSPLTITESGPIGAYSSSLTSAEQIQALLRSGTPLPAATLAGVINEDATLTTSQTISQIQAQLASTALPYDVIALQPPPGAYSAAIDGLFQSRNGVPGSTEYNANASGALIQAGADTLAGGEDLDAYYFYDYVVRFNMALADASSGGVGRLKIAEGGSVLPTDRIFFRYSTIHNALMGGRRTSLNRFVPGFERTFFDGMTSFELRAPFATDALATSTLDGDTVTNGKDSRFGNLTMYAKVLLHRTDRIAFTGGLGIVLPTAGDTRVNYADGTSLLRVENESVHLQPFLGMLYTPDDRFFAQSFLQYDATASGNSVAINSSGTGLQDAGKLSDADNIFFDASVGYWLYRNDRSSGLTGIVPTLEVHQTNSTTDGNVISSGPFQVGDFGGSTSITSMVAGTTLEFGKRTQLTAGYATQLGGGSDRQYDGAFQFFFNHLLGQ